MITSYCAPKALVKRVVLKNGLRFYSSMASWKIKNGETGYLAIKGGQLWFEAYLLQRWAKTVPHEKVKETHVKKWLKIIPERNFCS